MNIFQSIVKNFGNVGISPNQSRLNKKVLLIFTGFWLNTILNCVFCIREVNSFSELVLSILMTVVCAEVALCFTFTVINATEIFDVINNAEKVANIGNT